MLRRRKEENEEGWGELKKPVRWFRGSLLPTSPQEESARDSGQGRVWRHLHPNWGLVVSLGEGERLNEEKELCVCACVHAGACVSVGGKGGSSFPSESVGTKSYPPLAPAVTLGHNQLSQIIPGKTICKGAKGA